MLKTLIKKQLLELKYMYFKDKKSGKYLKGSKVLGLSILLLFVYLSCAFAFYGIGELLGSVLLPLKQEALFFTLFGAFSITVGTVVSMFFASSIIYNAKDNDLLIAMPIKPSDIVLSRLFILFINCLIYTSIVWLPAVLNIQIHTGFNISSLICGIVMLIILALMALVLSSLLGLVVSYFSRKFKNKAYITTIVSLFFIGIYYYFNFNLNKYLNALVANIGVVNETINSYFAFVYYLGKAACGDYLRLLISLAVIIVITSILIYFITRSFNKIVMVTPNTKKAKFNNVVKEKSSVEKALIIRELRHLVSDSTYMLNTGLGIVFLLAGLVAGIIKKDEIMILSQYLNNWELYFALGITVGVMTIVSMDAFATPAVSLEGNTYWLIRSLPVDSYRVLKAKRDVQIILNLLPALLASVGLAIIFGLNIKLVAIMGWFIIVYMFFVADLDLLLGIKGAKLEWTSEIVPIKQSINVLFAIFIPWIFAGTMFGLCYYLNTKIVVDISLYLLIASFVFLVIYLLLEKWIKVKGTKLFEEL